MKLRKRTHNSGFSPVKKLLICASKGVLLTSLPLFVFATFESSAAPAGKRKYAEGIAGGAPQDNSRPKLIVAVVFDQFRADYLMRFHNELLPEQSGSEVGGFRYLMNKGAYYPFGKYEILQAMTGPGHSIILSGSYPYRNGIPINEWFEPGKKEKVYCVEDAANQTVGAEGSDVHLGTSPRNFMGTTVGDELKNAGNPSRVVSVAIKDRAAILMGGRRADIAVWMDQKSFKWVTSKFYAPDAKLPSWIEELNTKNLALKGKTFVWDAKGKGNGLSLENAMAVPTAKGIDKLGLKFPHTIDYAHASSLTSPYGLDVTVDLAERAFDEYKLGTHASTDLLAVSFSSFDYVGHAYGPNSREMEEMTLAADKSLSKLLNSISKKMPHGLEDVVIVLTSDHGVSPNPDWLKTQRVDSGRILTSNIAKTIDDALTAKFGSPEGGKWIVGTSELNFYLNQGAIESKKLKSEEVEALAKAIIKKSDGIFTAFTSTDYQQRHLPPGVLERQILNTYIPGRSGDIVAIPKPFYLVDAETVTHYTGYNYDTTVPIVIAGKGIKPGRYSQEAKVNDIAPTLSYLSGVLPPAVSEGRVLSEILKDQR